MCSSDLDEISRTVSVHPAIMIEALRKIYGAGKLADELERKGAAEQKPARAAQPAAAGHGK